MIAGIVVAGFGLASVYIAPLANFLIAKFGLSQSMLIFGVAFLAVVCTLAMFLEKSSRGVCAHRCGTRQRQAALMRHPRHQ